VPAVVMTKSSLRSKPGRGSGSVPPQFAAVGSKFSVIASTPGAGCHEEILSGRISIFGVRSGIRRCAHQKSVLYKLVVTY
jgi:hypothetical protein